MRKSGTVVRWDGARGFGFIRGDAPGTEIFFHIRDFRSGAGGSPRLGLAVTFEEIHVGGKGPRAMAVQEKTRRESPAADSSKPHVGRPAHRKADAPPGSGAWLALPLMVIYWPALGVAVWLGRLPWWVVPASLFVNLLTFFFYWQDKYAASKSQWRISERSLHLWSVAGGWPGAWFAQQVLRHKSVKASFREVYWATAVFHCAAVAAWALLLRQIPL